MSSTSESPILTWTRDKTYLISTDPSLLPLESLNNDIFGADDFTWGKLLPLQQLQTLIQRSLCFGLYELRATPSQPESSTPSQQGEDGHDQQQLQDSTPPTALPLSSPPNNPRKLIGFARLITDFVSVNYLTDVYILPVYRSHGLGIWLMKCVDEVFLSMPHLRGMILIADRGSRNEEFYRRYLGMGDLAGEGFCMDRKREGGESG